MVQAIILAAGESSRFRPLSDFGHKSLTRLCGKALVRHTVESAFAGGIDEVIIVHGSGEGQGFREALSDVSGKINFVVQPEPKGMGNAVKCAASLIRDQFFVLNADRFDAGKYIQILLSKSSQTGAEMVLLSNETNKPWKYGMLGFDPAIPDKVIKVVEKPEAGTEPSNKKIVGVYLLPRDFTSYYDAVEEHQYAFEDALYTYARQKDCRAVMVNEEMSSTKFAFDLLDAAKNLLSGQKSNISPAAKIAESATIEGNVHIGDNTRIFENAVIKGPVYIGSNCIVGNNALVRENSILEDGVNVGMNTEVARSILMDGAHIHSGFVGDSIIGKNCRIGANFIVGNRRLDRENVRFMIKGELADSKKSFLGCVIGHNIKIGINASTMPGTIIGSNCIIGSGTEVKGNIDPGTTAYSEKKLLVKKNNTTTKKMKCVVFDADNTLYRTKEIAKSADMEAMKILAKATKSDPERLYVEWLGFIGTIKSSTHPQLRHRKYSYAKLCEEHGAPESVMKDMYEKFSRFLLDNITAVEGIKKILEVLFKNGIEAYVTTEDNRNITEKKLQKLGLLDYFHGIITSDDVGEMKPSPKYYIPMLSKWKPSEILVVGDGYEKDLKIPAEMGMQVILVENESDVQKIMDFV